MSAQDVDLSENNSGPLVGASVSLLVLSWFAISLRTYTRAILMKSFKIDDWLMLVAQFMYTLTCAMILGGVHRGLGRHNQAVPVDDQVAALMVRVLAHPSPPPSSPTRRSVAPSDGWLTWASDDRQWQALAAAVYILDMMFIKLSIGVFLLRLSVGSVYKWILRVSLFIISFWSIGIFFWDIFQCSPVMRQWDIRIDGRCAGAGEIISAIYALSVMTVLSDWLYALLPIPLLWNVKMTKQAKATVIVVLGLGIFASFATLVRLKFLSGIEEMNDLMFTATDAFVWTVVEPGVAIIASSLATIRPLLRAMKIRGFQSSDDDSPSTGGQYPPHLSRATARGSMHGFGPNDVSLHDVAAGASATGPRQEAAVKEVGRRFAGFGAQADGPTDTDDGQPSDGKSEVYVIEGNKDSPTWSLQDFHPTTLSLENFHDLEEQCQGLGASNRRT
ncbi:integral membrane family protein [Drechmeria coniospora]|uniref:Integral membrane family protein n=1 Tax=Drechmeria coniospora TaxID=98403 RepID=A0A151GF20_DRECN|nr:integral membrane family protein [Drechmeria coniospora]KYK55661.1 integral membrane family protein [Drechmeria coniospora]